MSSTLQSDNIPSPAQQKPHPRESVRHKRTKANETTSPLLRLPKEIRDLIYAFTLGGQSFHLASPHRHDPVILQSPCGCNAKCNTVVRFTTGEDRQHWCHSKVPIFELTGEFCSETLSIGDSPLLLYTCKTIYLEARPVWYSANSFNFFEPIDLYDFIDKTTGWSLVPLQPLPFSSVRIMTSGLTGKFVDVRIAEKLFKECPGIGAVYVGDSVVVVKPNLSVRLQGELEKAFKLPLRSYWARGRFYVAEILEEAEEKVFYLCVGGEEMYHLEPQGGEEWALR